MIIFYCQKIFRLKLNLKTMLWENLFICRKIGKNSKVFYITKFNTKKPFKEKLFILLFAITNLTLTTEKFPIHINFNFMHLLYLNHKYSLLWIKLIIILFKNSIIFKPNKSKQPKLIIINISKSSFVLDLLIIQEFELFK
jgi:hypothetical protein